MKQLQKREKVLLTILLLIAVTVLPIVFLVQPLVTDNASKQTIIQDLANQRMVIETAIAQKSVYESQLKELQDQFGKDALLIPDQMKNYDIHYFVNDICEEAGAVLVGLSIGDYTPLTQTDASGQNQQTLISKATLQLTLDCGFRQLLNVTDAFAAYAYTDVTGFYADLTASAAQSTAEDGTVQAAAAATSTAAPTVLTVDLYAAAQPGSDVFDAVLADQAAAAAAAVQAADPAASASAAAKKNERPKKERSFAFRRGNCGCS